MNSPAMLTQLCHESPEFARLMAAHQAHHATLNRTVPRVVVCGLLKAGKSTLLNALTNHLTDDFFATCASRATVAVKEALYDNVLYVDTPGLDACAADDEEAWRGLVGVDQILFVHNMRVGAFDVQELAFLKQLKQQQPEVLPHMIVVLSNVESVIEGRDERIAAFRTALSGVLGFCPPLLLTSWPRYQKGVLENKVVLRDQSGIPELQQVLKRNLAEQEQTRLSTRQAQAAHYRTQMVDLVKQVIARRKAQMVAISEGQLRREQSVCREFALILTTLKKRIQQYNNI